MSEAHDHSVQRVFFVCQFVCIEVLDCLEVAAFVEVPVILCCLGPSSVKAFLELIVFGVLVAAFVEVIVILCCFPTHSSSPITKSFFTLCLCYLEPNTDHMNRCCNVMIPYPNKSYIR